MAAHDPRDWPRLFEQAVNAEDLEEVVVLYDADARFVARSGETLEGRDRIREVLAALIGARAQLRSRVVRAITAGDVALLETDFDGTVVDDAGRTVPVHHRAIEVLRRQPDGAWKLVIGDPNGRAPSAEG